MVSNEELEGYRKDHYFARSWALLTRDKGWIKPVLVMTVAAFVPVVGWLGILGYVLEWARLTAWGVNSAPKQKKVGVGKCISSGWRAFVVLLVWSVASALIGWVLGEVPLIGGLLSLVWGIFGVFVGMLAMAAALRATIYQKIKPGLRVGRVWEMGSHDVAGLLKVWVIKLVSAIVVVVVDLVVLVAVLGSYFPQLLYMAEYVSYYGTSDYMMVQMIMSLISALGPVIAVLALIDSFINVIVTMLTYTAVGLWMRQFDVPAWGADEDPLPPFVKDPREAQPWQQPNGAAQQPGSGYGYQQSQEPGGYQQQASGQNNYQDAYQQAYQSGWQQGYEEARRQQTPTPGPEPEPEPAPEQPKGPIITPPPAGSVPSTEAEVIEVETIAVAPEKEDANEDVVSDAAGAGEKTAVLDDGSVTREIPVAPTQEMPVTSNEDTVAESITPEEEPVEADATPADADSVDPES